jgi:hypothetical protein
MRQAVWSRRQSRQVLTLETISRPFFIRQPFAKQVAEPYRLGALPRDPEAGVSVAHVLIDIELWDDSRLIQ